MLFNGNNCCNVLYIYILLLNKHKYYHDIEKVCSLYLTELLIIVNSFIFFFLSYFIGLGDTRYQLKV